MKKLWNRFRRWLIVKLGGYLPADRVVFTRRELPLVRVTAEVTISPFELDGYEFAERVIKERLAREMYRELVKSGLIVYQRSDDNDPLGISYRASFKAVVPEGEVDYGD